jgi:hypothetical protein
LRFIYCQDIELQYSLAIDLLALVERYDMIELKEICEDFLSKELTKNNVIELANVAECFEATHLKYAIAQFKQKNH